MRPIRGQINPHENVEDWDLRLVVACGSTCSALQDVSNVKKNRILLTLTIFINIDLVQSHTLATQYTSSSRVKMAGIRINPRGLRSTVICLSILLAIVYVAWHRLPIGDNSTGQLLQSFGKDYSPILFNESLPSNQDPRADDYVGDALKLQERAFLDGLKLKNLYNKYKKKGKELRCVLEGTKATSTPWTDYGALETWGWQLTQDERPGDYSHVQKQVCVL